MAAPNIVLTTLIEGKTDVLKLGASPTAITSNASGSGRVFKINLLQVANVYGTGPLDVSASVYRGNVDYFIAYVVAVPADGSLVLVGKENPIYLNEGDSIRLQSEVPAGAAGETLHAICSYEIISD
jgi:hypothetical protein